MREALSASYMDDRFSARRGTYRVIYRIDDKAMAVTVVDIDHRRDVLEAVRPHTAVPVHHEGW